jgi:hypothetical protein
MSDAGEFLRNATAYLLDYAQMWVDAAVIASGRPASARSFGSLVSPSGTKPRVQ